MREEFDKERLKYLLILFIAVLLFLGALMTKQILLNIPVIILGAYLYKYASPVLLKEYNEKRRKRLAEAKTVQRALQESIKKNKEDKNV